MTKVLYPGSFNPITFGHINIIEQATILFDEVIIAILNNPSKKNVLFTSEERLEIIKEIYKKNEKIKVVMGTGAAVDVAMLHECKAIVRGIRSLSDFDYEIQMANVNRDISKNQVRTVPLFADLQYQFISSSVVREVFSLDKDISGYVPPLVEEKMKVKKMV